jgi:hypothetical protein
MGHVEMWTYHFLSYPIQLWGLTIALLVRGSETGHCVG